MMHHYWLFYDKLMCTLKFLLVFCVINDLTKKFTLTYKRFQGTLFEISQELFETNFKLFHSKITLTIVL